MTARKEAAAAAAAAAAARCPSIVVATASKATRRTRAADQSRRELVLQGTMMTMEAKGRRERNDEKSTGKKIKGTNEKRKRKTDDKSENETFMSSSQLTSNGLESSRWA